MDFRQLETFIEVANLKSFSKAAEKLFITQPTVTNHIQNLEKELDSILLNRLGKEITLTDAGKLLYTHAVNILNSCQVAKYDLASYKGIIQGHLRIYSSSIPRKYFLPDFLSSFIGDFPDVSFTISEKDSKDVINSILDGETDFGILGAKYESSHLEYIDLIDDNLLLVTPNNDDFPWENFSQVNKNILFDKKFIFREEGSGSRNLIEKSLAKKGIPINRLKVIGYVDDIEVTKKLIASGLGISLISERAVSQDLYKGDYKLFHIKDLNFQRKFYFAYHKNRQLSPLSNSFKEYLLTYLEK